MNQSTDILASPTQLNNVRKLFHELGLDHDIVIDDAQSLVHDAEIPEQDFCNAENLPAYKNLKATSTNNMFRSYHRYYCKLKMG